ncbi:MAG: hypothetical protein A4E52_01740 [Pelotomaculum sp. PtaB.Bin013]|uniref:Uncharacterized protein n=1 Tax=Pelotomaculum isophthalicicum JI TaxID=947010 RepID=A0A9X4JVH7_9FIRM|nr:hypothetical protein [Pelotomaculum isophthalicicum]MDF9408351.1 hypothetical protein [Pelotomaculum isophthalicicum JI]OPX83902.1 MAG: hypothetical protein A4E52_01740 [Pelotomaculum sp. PtaB.Bin013]
MPTLYYPINDLGRGQTTESQEFNVLSEEDVDVVLVQYAYDSNGYLVPAHIDYKIGDILNHVDGIFKSQSTTITFPSVSAGTHRLKIRNTATDINGAYGNGYIYY